MEFGILGPLEVVDGGRLLHLGGAKQRSLLAMLLLHANEVVSKGRLCEELWADRPSARSAATLQVHVSNLRKLLEREQAHPHILLTKQPGYTLAVPPEGLDALRFQGLVAQAGAALARRDFQEASDLLRAALALWRGPALSDLSDEPFVRSGVVRLEEARLVALEDRIEADLALGRHTQLVGELESAVEHHPLRERLQGQLMVALYRSGRQVDALRTYSHARRALVDDLGIEPTPALQRLELAILTHDSTLAEPKKSPPPEIRRTVPRSLQVSHYLTFFGRDTELALLERCWKDVSTGRRWTVLVGGEPGVGKSRLATEIALVAHDEGALVLHGRCDSELGLAYQPFIEALRDCVAACPEPVLAAHLEAHGGQLARLIPELRGRVPGMRPPTAGDPDAERYFLFEAVTCLLAATSVDHPVVLVLDDLHWATTPTLLLLRHLLTSSRSMALLVVGTYRQSELGSAHALADLLADLRRQSDVERVSLVGLSNEEVVGLVGQAAGHPLDDRAVALAEAVWRETGGNPFFVTEILRHLAESGDVATDGAGWSSSADVATLCLPESVREVIGRRLRRLSPAAKRALSMASVIGAEFQVRLLESVAGFGEDELLDALAEASAAGLVAEVTGRPERFSFSHALVRQTLYQELGGTRRARLHRRIAEALEALVGPEPGPQLADLAHHWSLSDDPRDQAIAGSYARRAGDWALEELAYEVAADHYERALRTVEGESDQALLRCDLLLAFGDALRRAGDPRYRHTMADAATLARALDEPVRLAAAALGSSRPCSWFIAVGSVDEPLVRLYEEALAALDPGDSILRARLLSQLAVELYWTPSRDRRRALCDDALATARRMREPAGLASVLPAIIVARWDPTTLEERRVLGPQLSRLGTELGSLEAVFQGRVLHAGTLLEDGDADSANRELDAATDLADRLHQPFYLWLTRTLRTMKVVLSGAASAEGAAWETFQIGQASGQPDAALILSVHINLIRWDQGRLGEIEQSLLALVEQMPRIPAFRAALAVCYGELGRRSEASQEYDAFAGGGFRLPFDWAWYAGMTMLAESCALVDDSDRAMVLYKLLLPFADRVALIGNGEACLGAVSRSLAVLAATSRQWGHAEHHFERALDTNRCIGAWTFLVRTQRAYGEMLLARNEPGDRDRALKLAADGMGAAEALGMSSEAERLHALLR